LRPTIIKSYKNTYEQKRIKLFFLSYSFVFTWQNVVHPGVGFELTDVPTLHEIFVGDAMPVLQLDVEQQENAIS